MPKYIATKAAPDGSYDAAGAVSHEFSAAHAAAAEAYCLMHDLRLEGVYKGGATAGDMEKNDPAEQWKKPGGPLKGDRPLSKKQKATLCQLAAAVFRDLDDLGLADAEGSSNTERMQNWRREEVRKVTGLDSLTKCRNSHYRRIHDHLSTMTGKQYESPQMKCTGPQTSERDTMEAREQAINLINCALAKHEQVVNSPETAPEVHASQHAKEKGGPLHPGYILAIARNQNKAADLRHIGDLVKLPFEKLDNLLSTTRNRIAAREGRGNSRNRNKSQRKKKK